MKILIFDSFIIIRNGLEKLIGNNFPESEIFVANSFEEVIAYASSIVLDIVFVDIKNNDFDNFNIIKELKNKQPNCKILIFSDSTDDAYCIRCFNSGANGFLNKNCTEENIRQSINLLLNGANYFSKSVSIKLIKMKSNKKNWKKEGTLESLSTREFQIAKMLSSGESNLSISGKLKLSMSSISTYKKRVLLKTNTNNVLEIAALFKRENL